MYVELKDDSSNRVVLSLPKETNITQTFTEIVEGLLDGRSPARVFEDLVVEHSEGGIVFPPPANTQLRDTINISVRIDCVEVSINGSQFTHYLDDGRGY